MAETRIADVVVPEVFTPYTMERSLNTSKFFQSGIINQDPLIAQFLNGGGKTCNIPYWKDITGASDVPSETVATTVNSISTDKMIARRQIREKAWGATDLSAALAGADPYAAIVERVTGFWGHAFDDLLVYTCRGIVADNIANDSGDLVKDISTEDGSAATSANKISATSTIDAVMKQGEHFDELIAICVHPTVYTTLLKNDLIDYVVDSQANLKVPFYMGLRVIISKNVPAIAGITSGYKYHSYLFKAGAFGFGQTAGNGIIPTEVYRDPTIAGGRDILYTRRQFVIHPLGFAWSLSSDTGITPTDANLYGAASWDRVYGAENCGLVTIISNG